VSRAPDKAKTCALCDKLVDPVYRPFCSRRCADVDLQRWFAGTYAVPAEEGPSEIDDGDPDRTP
jgi:hypothetical protein